MICSFLTNDNNHKYNSNMGNNLTPYSIAVGEESIYFLTPHLTRPNEVGHMLPKYIKT